LAYRSLDNSIEILILALTYQRTL